MRIGIKRKIKKVNMAGRPPKILLVYPFSKNKNTSPPLGPAMIAAVLTKAGCDVRVVDAAGLYVEDGNERIADAIEKFEPDAIALSLIVGNAHFAYSLIENTLSKAEVPIVAGGPHATILPEEALDRGVDITVRGEGEESILDIVEWLRGKKGLESIDGISYKNEENKVVNNPDRAPISDLDTLPLPAHGLFNPADYFANESEHIRGGRLISSRGCPNKCSFCANPIFGRKFRYRSPDSIVAEMKYLNERYKTDKFEFLDDAFTTNRKRIFEFADKLKKLPDITFSCVTRLENLDDETIPALRAAGMFKAHIGVESMRPETLKRIHKNIDMDKLVPVLKLLKKNGVESYLFFMHGFPWESAPEMRENLEALKSLVPLTTYFAEGGVVVPYPGTQIYEDFRNNSGLADWWLKDWSPGEERFHILHKHCFFPYNDEQKAVIRETLDFIFEHNRMKPGLSPAGGEEIRLKPIVETLENNVKSLNNRVRELDSQLKEIWNRSIERKAKRVLNLILGKKDK